MGLSRAERLTRDLIAMRLSSRDPHAHMSRQEARAIAKALLDYDWQACGIESIGHAVGNRTIVGYTTSAEADRGEVLTFVLDAGERPRRKIWRA